MMTFDEWWAEQSKKGDPDRNPHITRDAWNAAVLSASDLCEELGSRYDFEMKAMANECAEKIMDLTINT